MTVVLALVIVLAQAPAGSAQTSATSDAAVIARGWTALAGGRATAALADADRVLSRRPWDHAAMLLKVNALAATDPVKALDAYEKWLGNSSDDVGLLEPVAREVVRAAANGSGPLAREGRRALTLGQLAPPDSTPADEEPFTRDAAAARNGNADAVRRLRAAATDPDVRDKQPLVAALEQAGRSGIDALVTVMQNDRGPAAGNAARALGRLGATEAVPALQSAMNTPDPYVRFSASVALARLGDPTGREAVNAMVASRVPDVRLMSAEAWNGEDGPWVPAVLPLLDNPDGDIRLRAARLVAPFHLEAAKRTLEQAAGDPNPAIRAEALKATADVAQRNAAITDVPTLRARLRDADPAVRFYAAAGLLALARTGR
jgi:hypothetical protein